MVVQNIHAVAENKYEIYKYKIMCTHFRYTLTCVII